MLLGGWGVSNTKKTSNYKLSKKNYILTYTHILVFCDLHTHFMIENVCVSHKIFKHRVLLRVADRDWQSVVCDGPNWCLADYLLGNYYQNLKNNYQISKKDYFVTYTHILVFCDLHTHFLFCDLPTLFENGKAGATPNIWQLLSCALLTLWDFNSSLKQVKKKYLIKQ